MSVQARPQSGKSPVGAERERLERAKMATAVVFATSGMAFASWAGRLPAVRDALGLTPGQLGLLLLGGAAGSLIGLPLAGRTADRFGAAATVLFGSLLLLSGLLLMGFAIETTGSAYVAGALLFLMCLGMGQWDVAMNLHGAEVERGLGRTIMPRFHAAFSLGTVFAALIAAALARAGLPLSVHFAVISLLLAALTLYALRFFVRAAPTQQGSGLAEQTDSASPTGRTTGGGRSAWTEPRILLIGFVVLVAAFAEGTANDWLSIAFVDGHEVQEWAGVLGLATFLTFMTIGRVAGTHLLDTYGRVPVLRGTLVLAGVGSLLMVFGNTPLAFVGAAVWGFGASLGFPVGMSAAADNPKLAAKRVAVVSTIGYLAFLAGPPVLGFLGDHWGVLRSLSVVSVLIGLALLALPAVRERSD